MSTNPQLLSSPRPTLAVLCGELPPYRLHFHRRLAREVPELALRTLLFPFRGATPWRADGTPPEVGLVPFVPDRPAFDQALVDVRAFSSLRQLLSPRSLGQQVRLARAERATTRRLLRWLAEHRPAAMIANGYGNAWDRAAIRWCRRAGVPCFLWADSNIHGDRATGWRWKLKHRYVSRLLAGCAGILPCGKCGIAFFERYGVPRGKMHACPIEPDYALIEECPPEAMDAARARFRLDPARRRLVVSCRLVSLKRVDTAIDAFLSVADLRPDWDLVIVGGGPVEPDLRLRVPARHAARVRFTGFIEDPALIAAIYRQSDVLVHPAEMEAWALVVLEAAAAGMALVASTITGAAHELLVEGENGRFFPPGDADALTDLLLDVTTPARLDAMKRRTVQVFHDWRRANDPIAGVRSALASARVLPS